MDDINAELEAFLKRHLADGVEMVERLQGGLTNYAFRLYLKNEMPISLSNNSNNHNLLVLIQQLKPKSLIAKIAHPYVAALGKEFRCTMNRQSTEEKALKLFGKFSLRVNDTTETSVDLSSVLYRNKMIQIGRVWLYDEIDNVLILEDHGPLLNIAQCFISDNRLSSSEVAVTLAQMYGEQLGKFIIDLQVSSLPHIGQLELLLRNREEDQISYKETIDNIRNTCKTHEIPDSDEILTVLTTYCEHVISCASTDDWVLAHGDLWEGNLLVDERNLIVSIIDWELAAIRSPAYDLALLVGRTQVLHVVTDVLYEPILTFTNAFINAYRDNAKKGKVSWYEDEREQYLFAWSLGIVYGVILMSWWPFQKCCPVQNEICEHQRNSIIQGVDFIMRCRSGPDKTTYDFISRDEFLGRLF
jgi:thiamine kinase-like enzyme